MLMYDHTLHRGKHIFIVNVSKLLVQKKYQKAILNTVLKLMVKKILRCLRRMNILN